MTESTISSSYSSAPTQNLIPLDLLIRLKAVNEKLWCLPFLLDSNGNGNDNGKSKDKDTNFESKPFTNHNHPTQRNRSQNRTRNRNRKGKGKGKGKGRNSYIPLPPWHPSSQSQSQSQSRSRSHQNQQRQRQRQKQKQKQAQCGKNSSSLSSSSLTSLSFENHANPSLASCSFASSEKCFKKGEEEEVEGKEKGNGERKGGGKGKGKGKEIDDVKEAIRNAKVLFRPQLQSQAAFGSSVREVEGGGGGGTWNTNTNANDSTIKVTDKMIEKERDNNYKEWECCRCGKKLRDEDECIEFGKAWVCKGVCERKDWDGVGEDSVMVERQNEKKNVGGKEKEKEKEIGEGNGEIVMPPVRKRVMGVADDIEESGDGDEDEKMVTKKGKSCLVRRDSGVGLERK